MLDPAASPRPRPEGRVDADAGLDAGLLVAADDAVERVEPLVLPVALVQVQHDRGLGEEVRARGKIQCSYCQGLMASASRISQTVVRLMGLFSSSRARLARSVVDCRLRGLPVRATTSQAMETTTALSRGGKDGLAASPRVVLRG